MKWILIVGGVLVALVVLMLVVGVLLPREHVAASVIELRQPRDSVWRAVRDFGATPTWWTEVKTSVRSDDAQGRERWQQDLKNGFAMPLVITEEVPPARLVTTIDVPANAAFGGTWTYELTQTDGRQGTTLTVTERGYVNNPLFRFMARFIFGYHGTLNGYLQALGRRFGEEVEPRNL